MDDTYKRLVYVRYADDFLIGVIGSKDDARQVKADVGTFIQEQLHLELSQEKTLITHGNDFAHFLSFDITTSTEQNSTRTKGGYTKRSYTGRVKLYVPKEKWVKRLLAYGALKIHYDKAMATRKSGSQSAGPAFYGWMTWKSSTNTTQKSEDCTTIIALLTMQPC